jgi:hypothetical protein
MRHVQRHATVVALGFLSAVAPMAHAAAPSHLALDAKFCSRMSMSGTGTAYTLKCDALPCTPVVSAPSAAAGSPIVAALQCTGGATPSSYQWSVSGDASCPRPGAASVDQHILTAASPATCTYRVIATSPGGEKGSGVFALAWR